jgi:hypothetical protein
MRNILGRVVVLVVVVLVVVVVVSNEPFSELHTGPHDVFVAYQRMGGCIDASFVV